MLEGEREVVQAAGAEQRRAPLDRVRQVAQRFAIAVAERGSRLIQPPPILLDEVADELTQEPRVEGLAALTHGFQIAEVDSPGVRARSSREEQAACPRGRCYRAGSAGARAVAGCTSTVAS